MYKGGGMDDLNHGSEAHCALSAVVQQLGREQQKRGPDSLAAACTQIFADLGDRAHARDGVAAELTLQRDEIVPQQVEDFFTVDGRWRAHVGLPADFTT